MPRQHEKIKAGLQRRGITDTKVNRISDVNMHMRNIFEKQRIQVSAVIKRFWTWTRRISRSAFDGLLFVFGTRIDPVTRIVQLSCAGLLIAAGVAYALRVSVHLNWELVLAFVAAALVASLPYMRSGELGPQGFKFSMQPVEEPSKEEIVQQAVREVKEASALPNAPDAPEMKPKTLIAEVPKTATTLPQSELRAAASASLTSFMFRPEEAEDPEMVVDAMVNRIARAAGVKPSGRITNTVAAIATTGVLTKMERDRLWLLAMDIELHVPNSELHAPWVAVQLRNELSGIARRIAMKRLTTGIADAARRHGKTIKTEVPIGTGNRGRLADLTADDTAFEIVPVILRYDRSEIDKAERFLAGAGIPADKRVVAVAAAIPLTETLAKASYACAWLDGDAMRGNEKCVEIAGWLFT